MKIIFFNRLQPLVWSIILAGSGLSLAFLSAAALQTGNIPMAMMLYAVDLIGVTLGFLAARKFA